MPYSNEYANPRGYEDLVLNAHLRERLATYRFQPPTEKEGGSFLDDLEARKLEDLPIYTPLSEVKYACAVDGSIARMEEESSFELAALKFGAVVESLQRMDQLNEQGGIVDPRRIEATYRTQTSSLLLSGRGIYGEDDSEALWQDKFRQELHESLKHLAVPYARTLTLSQALKELTPRQKTVSCFSCSLMGVRVKDVPITKAVNACPRCYKDYYLSDGLFVDWGPLKDSATGVYLHLMTTLERLMLQGIMAASRKGDGSLPFGETLFITDGSLACYGAFHHLNEWLLKDLQSWPEQPLLMSLEKHGGHRDFALTEEVQEIVKPGMVALVPTEISSLLSARTQESSWGAPLYAYGKRFIYRSKNGDRTFVLMVPPKEGRPHKFAEDDDLADAWENYPTLRTCCEFLEAHTIAQFGPNEPAIDIMAKANHAASLPKVLSAQVLRAMVRDLQNELL